MSGLILLTDSQTILLRKFCELFPPVINDNRPTGDFEEWVPEEILDNEGLLRVFLSSIWEAKGWDQLRRDSEMSDFMVFRIAPDRIFVMPMFRNIGFHPYTDKAGVVHNDEPYYWLNENNWWKRSLNFMMNSQVLSEDYYSKHKDEGFAIRLRRNLTEDESLKEVIDIQFRAMNESFKLDDADFFFEPMLELPLIQDIQLVAPYKVFTYVDGFTLDRPAFEIRISGYEYTSDSVMTSLHIWNPLEKIRPSMIYLTPFEFVSNPWVLNWLALKTEQFRDFISEITQ